MQILVNLTLSATTSSLSTPPPADMNFQKLNNILNKSFTYLATPSPTPTPPPLPLPSESVIRYFISKQILERLFSLR